MDEATIESLLADPVDSDGPAEGSVLDAAMTVAQLEEAELLDVRLDLVRSVGGFIFDLRVNPLFPDWNAAVVVTRGVKSLTWEAGWARESRWAWEVAWASAQAGDRLVDLRVEMQPEGGLRLDCLRLDINLISIPDLPETPPNYEQADYAALRAGQPRWDSSFRRIATGSLPSTPEVATRPSLSDSP